MTGHTFTINGHDYSDIVTRGSYSTNLLPVTISRLDLDKVEHVKVLRHRGAWSGSINPIGPARRAELYADLMDAPCTVEYESMQLNEVVSQEMIPSWDALKEALERPDGTWTYAVPLSFLEA